MTTPQACTDTWRDLPSSLECDINNFLVVFIVLDGGLQLVGLPALRRVLCPDARNGAANAFISLNDTQMRSRHL